MKKLKIEFLKVEKPSNIAVSSARTCYYPNGIVKPEKSENWDKKDNLLKSIFQAGHHTTLQHTHITILIEGMSRHLIWRLLHSHPYYNSEQVSQRYAKMKIENVVFPKEANKKEWKEFYNKKFNDYEKLIKLLIPKYEKILPKGKKQDAIKKAQEIARYLLPVGMNAYLYHTVNIITILRYISIAKSIPECMDEAKEFAKQLEKNLLELDISLKPLIDYAKKSNNQFPNLDINRYKNKFNINENENVKIFNIIDTFSDNNLTSENNNYGDILRTSQIFLDENVLGGFSSYIKLSLSADAQNQRHRRSLGVREKIMNNFKVDFYIPKIIKEDKEIFDFYLESNYDSYQFHSKESKLLGNSESVYCLLNAHNIEIIERDDFSAFHHKAQMRLCYNAQEEIFDIVYKQVQQLKKNNISIADNLLPPCAIRNKLNLKPICPEGDRFCGIKVWKLNFNNYKRDF